MCPKLVLALQSFPCYDTENDQAGREAYAIHRQEHHRGRRVQHRHAHHRLVRREHRGRGRGAAAVVPAHDALSDLRGHLLRHQPDRRRALRPRGEEINAGRGDSAILLHSERKEGSPGYRGILPLRYFSG